MDLKSIIRSIPDFPEKGIIFRDITTVLQVPEAFCDAVNKMADSVRDLDFDVVIGPESRGFIFGTPVAYKLNKGFVPVRKPGKLPYETKKKSYSLEYGNAELEIHTDAIKPGQRAVIIDDLLATGGTSRAIAELIEEIGGTVVAISFLIELEALGGRKILEGYDIFSAIKY